MEMKNFCDRALKLFRAHGGNAAYGAHYRELLLLLLARSIERIARFQKQGAPATPPMAPFLKREEVIAACESISGLPEEYVTALMRLVEP
jgi:hypothetical protein